MPVNVAFLFPGQGSQDVGMGRELAERHPAAREVFEQVDELLGASLTRIMWEGPEEELTATRNAQPAILAHSVAVLRAAEALRGAPLAAPRLVAGHSLGEFTAYVAAGSFSFADALRVVRRRGELMHEVGTARPGTMAAILGLETARVEEVCAAVEEGICVPANINAPGQVVISGDLEGVEEGMERASEAGARRVIRLDVSGAFHSPLMGEARDGLAQALEEVEIREPTAPVVSNVTAAPVSEPSEVRSLLVDQLTSPVRWSEGVATMLEAGVDEFVEIGPGQVLRGLSKRNARRVPCVSVGTPDEIEALVQHLEETE
jgi:[acyl-carrier-protein] S-malonyltransferase